jgi:hypothetical protein
MKTQVTAQVTTLSAALALAMFAPAAFAQLAAAGSTNSGTATLTDSRTTAGAYQNERRMFSWHPDVVVPRRSYIASCQLGNTRKIFASITSQKSSGVTAGMIISGTVEVNGSISGLTTQKVFSECSAMAGIAADANCSTVAVLCRKPYTANSTPTVDLVADLVSTSKNPSETPANRAAAASWVKVLNSDDQGRDDRMWLYEWKGTATNPIANPNNPPTKTYVASKALRSTATWLDKFDGPFVDTGHHALAMSGQYYALSLKSTTQPEKDVNGKVILDKNGNPKKHDGDSFILVNRNTSKIQMNRGYQWACGTGHTRSNRPALGTDGFFSVFCNTESDGITGAQAGIWMRTEGGGVGGAGAQPLVQALHKKDANHINGGAGALIPTAGGYLGVIVGNDTKDSAVRSKIGVVTFDKSGKKVGATRWVKSSANYYLGYPQLVQIGFEANGTTPRYLLGWAEMMAAPSTFNATQVAAEFNSPTPDHTQRVATHYYVQEIDATGNLKAAQKSLVHGWGEQDQMISAGLGRAAWVYRPDATIKLTVTGTLVPSTTEVPNPPSPYSPSLIFMTYKSADTTLK